MANNMKKLTQAEFDSIQRDEDGWIVIGDNVDCTEVNFNGVNRIRFGNGARFGEFARFDNYAQFGSDAWFDGFAWFGNDARFGNGAQFGDYAQLGNNARFGDDARFGERARFGEFARFDNYARFGSDAWFDGFAWFGNDARFGNGAQFGSDAQFESGSVKNGTFVTVGNIGTENRIAYFYIDENAEIFVRAGCWFSDADSFIQRVKKVHSGTVYEKQYLAALDYAKAILPLMEQKIIDKEGQT